MEIFIVVDQGGEPIEAFKSKERAQRYAADREGCSIRRFWMRMD